MSDITFRASISTNVSRISEKIETFSEPLRLRDLRNTVPLAAETGRAGEHHKSSSLLGLWMEESPFSHRQLMTQNTLVKKQSKELKLQDLLSDQRSKFSSEGYSSIMDVILTMENIKNDIENNIPLSKLTVRNKNQFQETLGLYEEHFTRVIKGFSHAQFSKDADDLVARIKHEIEGVLQLVIDVKQQIKTEIRPSLEDISFLRV